jgi:hypothetical protein
MKKYVYGLGALVVPSLCGAFMVTGCGEDGENGNPLDQGAQGLCGPCGEVAQGDIGISGDARLDGFFKALSTIQGTTVLVKTDFDANIRALAAVYGVEAEGAVDAELVNDLVAAIRADINANVQGSVTVNYQPPRCQANVNVAVEAQAKCEVKAGCDVQVNPGEASVSCQGTCTGSCEGGCTGELACEVTAPSIECTGSCEGACTFEAAAECNGTCRGECDGECSLENADGSCAGTCDGNCEGTCEFAAAATCEGTCSGKCLTQPGSAGCEASASCRGECTGECTGGCEGSFTPPSASASCEAEADCQASAKAEANASLDCSPPQLELEYAFAGNVDLEAQAEFRAKLAELRVRGVAIVQGAAKYEALLTGKVEGRVIFETPPVAELRASLQNLAELSVDGMARFDMPAAKIPCAVGAFGDSVQILGTLGTQTTATLEAQGAFVAAFTSGFDS